MRSARLALATFLIGSAAHAGSDLLDPTRPEIGAAAAAEPTAVAGRFDLRAVLIGSARRVAVINGSAVGVGDSVDGALVLAIDAGRVRIRTADGERELLLAASVRAKPVEKGSR